jgi:hypothetical protein
MDPHSDRALVEALIAAAAVRTAAETDRLAWSLRNRCWPGGPADRSEPGARTWLRRWRPGRRAPAMEPCSCAQGHCPVCN